MAYKCVSQMAKGDMVQHKINCNNIMYVASYTSVTNMLCVGNAIS